MNDLIYAVEVSMESIVWMVDRPVIRLIEKGLSLKHLGLN